ncbi:MAG: hypothetical protein KJ592_03065, partial [Nanoarchaeota archaeon]|nr:hypothetical protein [Nanoarchaeota archaeon]
LIDGGLDINANEKVFPSEDRLMGEHTKIADVVLKCKETISGKGSNPKSSVKLGKAGKAHDVEKLDSVGDLANENVEDEE